MFKNINLLEMDKGNICLKTIGFNNIKNSDSIPKDNIIKIVNMHKRKLYLILEGEQVYVKFIDIPKLNNIYKINEIVKNELIYEFNNIDSILYNYNILTKSKNKMKVAVYCININNNTLLKRYIKECKNISGIYSIQLSVLNLYKKSIKDKNFIFVFKHKNYTYVILYIENKCIYSSIIHEDENISYKIDEIINKIEHMEVMLEKVYEINLEKESLIREKLKQYKFISLEKFAEKDYKKII